jgi:DNA invertase Pin-like site-specific DNA recombinase
MVAATQSYRERMKAQRAGASFRSLGDPWADTTTPHGRSMLTVLGGLAEFERHLILSRTTEGRVRAKASRCSVRKEAEAHEASASRSFGEDGPGRES